MSSLSNLLLPALLLISALAGSLISVALLRNRHQQQLERELEIQAEQLQQRYQSAIQQMQLQQQHAQENSNDLRQRLQTSEAELNRLQQLQQSQSQQIADAQAQSHYTKELQQKLARVEQRFEEEQQRRQSVEQDSTAQQTTLDNLHEVVERSQSQLAAKDQQISQLQKQLLTLEQQLATTRTRLEEEQKASQEKIQILNSAEQKLSQQFENLANRIFDDKSKHLNHQHQQTLTSLLNPFKDQLNQFRQQVQDSYGKEAQERAMLKQEIHSLKALNLQMSQEALNLTKALKGDKKAQGNWGELILQRVLEESGLREGHEYELQASRRDEERQLYQPDVIVHLPDSKDVIIDAKVSLNAYESFHNSDDKAERQQYLKAHVAAIRNHIKGLSAKDYRELKGVRSLDYVLMFIPVEAAFMTAFDAEPDLFREAFEHNIMIVSPTSMMVALRTIQNIWRYERLNENAQLISRRAGRMYDKLRGFAEDMQKLGNQLSTAHQTYDNALNKFSQGRGSLVGQAQQLAELDINIKKPLPQELTDMASVDLPDLTKNR